MSQNVFPDLVGFTPAALRQNFIQDPAKLILIKLFQVRP